MPNYYSRSEVYNEKYYQMPIILFTSPKYNHLSNDSKIAYMLLKHRFGFSVKNNWCDENDNIYFIFTTKELEAILNCSKNTVTKIKQELETATLLEQKQMGFNSQLKKNKPNRLYLLRPEISPQDVFLIDQTLGNSGLPKFGTRDFETQNTQTPENSDFSKLETREPENKNDQILGNSGLPKFGTRNHGAQNVQTLDNSELHNLGQPKKHQKTLGNSGLPKFGIDVLYNTLDTLPDTLLDTVTDAALVALSQKIDAENAVAGHQGIPDRAKQLLLMFSFNDYKHVHEQIGMIFRAKKAITDETGKFLVIEDFEDEFIQACKVIANELFKDKKGPNKIKNADHYFYTSFKNYFADQVLKLDSLTSDSTGLPVVPLYNWTTTEG